MHLSLTYSSVIINRGGTTRCRELLSPTEAPVIDIDRLTWNAPKLGTAIQLDRRAPAHSEALIDTVDWHCLMPSARARFTLDGEPPIAGDGYAELLEMRIAPWKLPIDELRWGRFASSNIAVTWIDWRGGHPLKSVLVDGIPVAGAIVGDASIEAGDVSVTMGRDRIIRDEAIGETIKPLKALVPLLPSRITEARETKWCGRAAVRRGDATENGWAVHELVRFR